MNEHDIETLLRKAPRVRVPAGLQERLERDLELPQASRITNYKSRITNSAGLRRWIPALGFALWILGCVVVLGIQGNIIARAKAENAQLRAQAADAEASKVSVASPDGLAPDLDRLQKDAADAERLRAEIEQLRASLAQLPALRAANNQLREELKAKSQIAATPNPEDDIFAESKSKADRILCVNNLKQVCLAARIWANDNKDTLPLDFAAVVGRELPVEKVTYCPSDGKTRYEIMSPGVDETRPEVVYVRCAIHNNVGLVDGSVQQIGNRRIVQENSKWIIEKPQETGNQP